MLLPAAVVPSFSLLPESSLYVLIYNSELVHPWLMDTHMCVVSSQAVDSTTVVDRCPGVHVGRCSRKVELLHQEHFLKMQQLYRDTIHMPYNSPA